MFSCWPAVEEPTSFVLNRLYLWNIPTWHSDSWHENISHQKSVDKLSHYLLAPTSVQMCALDIKWGIVLTLSTACCNISVLDSTAWENFKSFEEYLSDICLQENYMVHAHTDAECRRLFLSVMHIKDIKHWHSFCLESII